MKYIVLIGDGMADQPVQELGGKTPLEAAATPNMDRLAAESSIGTARTIPLGMHPGSDVANLSILGYNPAEYYSGRAPLEAASMGISLGEEDVAYRCNLVTLKYNKDKTRAIMEDYSSGHISTAEARDLILDIDRALGTPVLRFYPGVSYRHLLIWTKGMTSPECVPPHDILGKDILDYLPVGRGEMLLRKLMLEAADVLENHPVNRERVKNGQNPGNGIWLWGQGRKPKLPTFRDKYGLSGALVSAVDLTRGLGVCAGFEILQVPGITGYLDTNYIGKAEASLEALKKVDFVYIHVEAPDEAGHSGKYKDKVRAIEDFDEYVVGTVIKRIGDFDACRILLMPDHPTPLGLRTHTAEPVPFLLYDSREKKNNAGLRFTEAIGEKEGALLFEEGHLLMDYFITARKG